MGLNCRQLHDHLMLPLIPIVQAVGMRGIPLDSTKRELFLNELFAKRQGLDAQLARFGVTEPGKRRQLGYQLAKLGVPLKTTEGGDQYKTDLNVFGKLHHDYNGPAPEGEEPFPFLPLLIQRARVEKGIGNIASLRSCDDGMLRTQLRVAGERKDTGEGTRTGRYSSKGWGRKKQRAYCPSCRRWVEDGHGANLQNISRGTEEAWLGFKIKELFHPAPGWRLGELDYSALELWLNAYCIGCTKLIERLADPSRDMHSEHATIMFERTITKADKKERTLAKSFIYALRGGGGDMAIQIALAKQDVHIDLDVIAQWRAKLFAEYPEMPQWIERTDLALAAQIRRGELRLIRNAFGRPRVLLGHQPLKEALATIISGTAADGMSFVLTRLAQYHPEAYKYVAMQIHDSYIVHAPAEKFDYVMRTVYEEMIRPWWAWDQSLPLRAEPSEAVDWTDDKGTLHPASWAHMEDWKKAA